MLSSSSTVLPVTVLAQWRCLHALITFVLRLHHHPQPATARAESDTTIEITSVGNAAANAKGVDPPEPGTVRGAFAAVRKAVQESTIWKTLNYSMNYDIHKVCGYQSLL